MKYNRRTSKLQRLTDRYAGIPLIFLPALYRKKQKLPEKIKRVCFVKTSGIGDTVLASAVVKDVMMHYSDASFTFVSGDRNFQVAKFLLSGVSAEQEYVSVDYRNFNTVSALRKLSVFDLLIDFGQWPRFDAFVSMIIKAKYRVGFKRARQYRHYGYDMPVEHRSDRHELNNFRALAEALGVPCLHSPQIESFTDSWLGSFGEAVCIHMCASGTTAEYRMWQVEKWVELCMHLTGRGYDVVFTGTESEREYIEMAADYAGVDRKSILLDMPFDYLSKIYRDCRYVISVDTGMAHLAAASGANLIELLGATNPDRWGALGESVQYVRPDRVDVLLDLGFEKHADREAINRVSVKQVLQCIS